MSNVDPDMDVSVIMAGKFRRYNHLSLIQHLTMPGVVIPNLVDTAKVAIGFIQSTFKLLVWRPDVIFLKGGFVCLPVGWAARLLRIPYIIHDSDAHPGLTNRLLAKHAERIATGAPLKYYSYPESKTKYVGIPVSQDFRVYSESEKRQIRKDLGLQEDRPLVVVTGGGLGAKRINDATVYAREMYADITNVVLLAGSAQFKELRQQLGVDTKKFRLYPFVQPSMMRQLMAAADVVVTRVGATTMLELAALGKATVMVPNARLTGGHQVKNAQVYTESNAGVMVEEFDDQDVERLANDIFAAVRDMLADPAQRKAYEQAIQKFARPKAAKDVADMLLRLYNGSKGD